MPVCLGSISIEKLYHYKGIAELKSILFLNYGGERLEKLLDKLTSKDKLLIVEQLNSSTRRHLQVQGQVSSGWVSEH